MDLSSFATITAAFMFAMLCVGVGMLYCAGGNA